MSIRNKSFIFIVDKKIYIMTTIETKPVRDYRKTSMNEEIVISKSGKRYERMTATGRRMYLRDIARNCMDWSNGGLFHFEGRMYPIYDLGKFFKENENTYSTNEQSFTLYTLLK